MPVLPSGRSRSMPRPICSSGEHAVPGRPGWPGRLGSSCLFVRRGAANGIGRVRRRCLGRLWSSDTSSGRPVSVHELSVTSAAGTDHAAPSHRCLVAVVGGLPTAVAVGALGWPGRMVSPGCLVHQAGPTCGATRLVGVRHHAPTGRWRYGSRVLMVRPRVGIAGLSRGDSSATGWSVRQFWPGVGDRHRQAWPVRRRRVIGL